jgi:hypothetical protein
MSNTHETTEVKAIRRGMSLMTRWHALPDARKLWDDLLVKSGVGEWVQYKDMKAHYDVVIAIIQRAQRQAEIATARADIAEQTLRRVDRERAEYASLCDEQAARIRQLEARGK